MRQFIVYYNNSFRILRSLPMRCSASVMFASSNVDSCQARCRRYIYIYIVCVVDCMSPDLITHSVIYSDYETKQRMDCDFI